MAVTTANNKVHFIYINRLFLIFRKTVFYEKIVLAEEISSVLANGKQTLVRCFDAQSWSNQEVFVFGTSSYVSANQNADQRAIEVQQVCKQALHFVYSDM